MPSSHDRTSLITSVWMSASLASCKRPWLRHGGMGCCSTGALSLLFFVRRSILAQILGRICRWLDL